MLETPFEVDSGQSLMAALQYHLNAVGMDVQCARRDAKSACTGFEATLAGKSVILPVHRVIRAEDLSGVIGKRVLDIISELLAQADIRLDMPVRDGNGINYYSHCGVHACVDEVSDAVSLVRIDKAAGFLRQQDITDYFHNRRSDFTPLLSFRNNSDLFLGEHLQGAAPKVNGKTVFAIAAETNGRGIKQQFFDWAREHIAA